MCSYDEYVIPYRPQQVDKAPLRHLPQDYLLLEIKADARHRHWLIRQSICLWTCCVKGGHLHFCNTNLDCNKLSDRYLPPCALRRDTAMISFAIACFCDDTTVVSQTSIRNMKEEG